MKGLGIGDHVRSRTFGDMGSRSYIVTRCHRSFCSNTQACSAMIKSALPNNNMYECINRDLSGAHDSSQQV